MNSLQRLHPVSLGVHLLSVIAVAMFVRQPVILCIALAGGAAYLAIPEPHACGLSTGRLLGFGILLCVGSGLLNPLWNQRGDTVLFFLNGRAVTAEALCYGFVAGLMLAAVFWWFGIFTRRMTADRIFCLLGSFAPRLGLIFTMGLRQTARLTQIIGQIRTARRAAGLAREDNLIDRTRENLHVFSATLSWAIENGIITADSMEARGYGQGRRTQLSDYGFRLTDGVHTAAVLLLTALIAAAWLGGCLSVQFYPHWQMPAPHALTMTAYTAYGLLCFYPAAAEVREVLQWRC